MGKVKIHEIAKKLGLTSKEVLEMANSLKMQVTSHMSGIDEKQAQELEEALSKKDNKKDSKKQGKEKKEKVEAKTEKKKEAKT